MRGLTTAGTFHLEPSSLDPGHRCFVFGKTVDPNESLLYKRFYRPLLCGRGVEHAALNRLWPGEPIFVPTATAVAPRP